MPDILRNAGGCSSRPRIAALETLTATLGLERARQVSPPLAGFAALRYAVDLYEIPGMFRSAGGLHKCADPAQIVRLPSVTRAFA